MSAPEERAGVLLVTGASGYIGGRLQRVLHERGRAVRSMARRPEEVRASAPEGLEVVAGDVLDEASLMDALRGVDTAYYLIHALGSRKDFAREERVGAENFARAARACGVRRIVYLGGLGKDDLSPHLASRHAVGAVLRDSGVVTLELRASVILGSGSLSFELARSLVERLPVLITPRWVSQRTQPIGVEDVIAYLVAAVDVALSESTVVEIGGSARVTYLDLMREYEAQRGLSRLFVRVPVLTPWLSSLWLGLVTPVYARVGRKLIDSLRNETVVTSNAASELFPAIHPIGMRAAVARALANEDLEFAETRWSDALSSYGRTNPWGGMQAGSRLIDSRKVVVHRAPLDVFRPIERIGGATGWYYGKWLWHVRGALDLVVGGPGMRRGRRNATTLRPGDTLDFWRVEAVEPGKLLRLRAEMKLPGRAWLQFEVDGDQRRSVIRQTAIFEPRGLAGLLYWYILYPVHGLIFGGMLRSIARAAAAEARTAPSD